MRMPTDKEVALADFRKAVAGILNIVANELPDGAKIRLAQILQSNPGDLRLHVALEPLIIIGAVFAPDRKTQPVELFRIDGSSPSGMSN
jgi:hypothetical protein